ncbi:hypothetical protein Acry_1565 [Acidiphilium cryptum JF-5]|uniref:Uncharacterized protein n=1 Tax=Acidiphilium cryptum (strain JF-5) TaxID=349163 RepID=A5FYT9_ACICJ|nr:hypothetical protein Acry_1565 [Acidiphilium cryptum JF-5]
MHPDHGIDRDHGGPRSDLNERPAPRLFATGCQGSASGRRRAILPDPRHHPDLIRCPATPGSIWRAAASPHRRSNNGSTDGSRHRGHRSREFHHAAARIR